MIQNILIADDSALMRKSLCDIIHEKRPAAVFQTVTDGRSAFEVLSGRNCDAAIINMYLPQKNGLEIIRDLHDRNIDIPIIIIGSAILEDQDAASLITGLDHVRYVVRPFRLLGEDRSVFAAEVTSALVSLELRRRPVRIDSAGTEEEDASGSAPSVPRRSRTLTGKKRLVAIASSTGGPQALHRLIPMLPAHIGVPVVIVQHMPKGFTLSLAERIDQQSHLRVKEAEDGEELLPDTVYLAPGGRHLEIAGAGGRGTVRITDTPPVNNLRPCADVMYRSLTGSPYDDIVCAVLTGMGRDGTDGITELRKHKRLHVITQAKETCVVYGMPKAADQAGLSDESVPLDRIAESITKELGV